MGIKFPLLIGKGATKMGYLKSLENGLLSDEFEAMVAKSTGGKHKSVFEEIEQLIRERQSLENAIKELEKEFNKIMK